MGLVISKITQTNPAWSWQVSLCSCTYIALKKNFFFKQHLFILSKYRQILEHLQKRTTAPFFCSALRAQSDPSACHEACCSWMELMYQKELRRWSRTTALTLVLWGPLSFKGRVEKQTLLFLHHWLIVCSVFKADTTCSLDTSLLGTARMHPGSCHVSSTAGGNYTFQNRIPTQGAPQHRECIPSFN